MSKQELPPLRPQGSPRKINLSWRQHLTSLSKRASRFSLRSFKLRRSPVAFGGLGEKSLGFLRSGQGVLIIGTLIVLAPALFAQVPSGIGGTAVRYRTVAEIASLASDLGLTNDPNYNTEELTTSLDGDYLFKTGTLETIISKGNRRETIEYEVKPGESLYSVADGFGLSTDTLRYINKLPGNTLKVGQKLRIPPVDGLYVTVKKGENLSALASRYRIETDNIYKYNPNLKEGEPIFAGQEIFIPGAVVPKAATGTKSGGGASVVGPSALPTGGQFIWPVASATKFISQGFGRTRWNKNHTGLDLNRLNGLTVYASAAGVVNYTRQRGYGNLMILNHGNGWETYYAHLAKSLVPDGSYVKQGQAIAVMGSSGWSTGTHLHFEIRKNGVPLNPLSYLPR